MKSYMLYLLEICFMRVFASLTVHMMHSRKCGSQYCFNALLLCIIQSSIVYMIAIGTRGILNTQC